MTTLTRQEADKDQLIDKLSRALAESDLALTQTREALDEALALAAIRDPDERTGRLPRVVDLAERATRDEAGNIALERVNGAELAPLKLRLHEARATMKMQAEAIDLLTAELGKGAPTPRPGGKPRLYLVSATPCAVGGCSRLPDAGNAYCREHTNPAAEAAELARVSR